MPRYFFHTDFGDGTVMDGDGIELRDADQAWEAARATVEATLSEAEDQARLMRAILVVVDEAGEVVFEFPFAEAVLSPAPAGRTMH